MRILLAPGTFKGSLTAEEATLAMADGVRNCGGEFEMRLLPVGDGGEGTSAALQRAIPNSREECVSVTGPIGDPVSAAYALLGPDYRTAALDMASAAGLLLVPEADRNPMRTTTYGVGQLIRAAIDRPNVQQLIVGLGGSATNDGGAGCLQGLGFELLDKRGEPITAPILPDRLADIHEIRPPRGSETAHELSITIACDVDNPLTGKRGASRVFGPQKGATPAMVDELDRLLGRFGTVLDRFARSFAPSLENWIAVPDRPGAGAALMTAFPQAVIQPGIDVVLDLSGFDEALAQTDLILTGEGRLDAQTLGGKAIFGVMRRAAPLGVPIVAIVGSAEDGIAAALRPQGVERVITLVSLAGSVSAAISEAPQWIARAARIVLEERA